MRRWMAAALVAAATSGIAGTAAADGTEACLQAAEAEQYDRALQLCANALEHDPSRSEAQLYHGLAMARTGDADGAIAALDRYIAAVPDDPRAYSFRARAYEARGDNDRVIADAEKALERGSNATEDYTMIGAAYLNKGDATRAIENCDKAVHLNPEYAPATSCRGRALFALGRFGEAVAPLQRHTADNPQDHFGVLWLYLSRLRAQPEAMPEFMIQAMQLDPDIWPGPIVRYYLGKLSLQELDKLAKTDAQVCETAFYVGELYLAKGDTAAAKPRIVSAKTICPATSIEAGLAAAELGSL